jgi:ABC-type Zn uptake system ZnuABC Zn-binding protein ZnuA
VNENDANANEKSEKDTVLNIETTDKLLYYMVKDLVNEKHLVDFMFSSRDEILKFNFSDDSTLNISKKDLFIYSGAGFEPWITNFQDKLSKSKVGIINGSRGIKLINYEKETKINDIVVKENPYYWLNVDNYKTCLSNIKNALQDKDSKNRDYYEDNFSKALKNIEPYEKKAKQIAEKMKEYTFVVDGDDIDYFNKYLGIKALKVYNYGVSSAEDLKIQEEKLEKELKDKNKIIFLYDTEEKLKANESIINKYNMETVNIIIYKDDLKYLDILDTNLEKLSQFTEKRGKSR